MTPTPINTSLERRRRHDKYLKQRDEYLKRLLGYRHFQQRLLNIQLTGFENKNVNRNILLGRFAVQMDIPRETLDSSSLFAYKSVQRVSNHYMKLYNNSETNEMPPEPQAPPPPLPSTNSSSDGNNGCVAVDTALDGERRCHPGNDETNDDKEDDNGNNGNENNNKADHVMGEQARQRQQQQQQRPHVPYRPDGSFDLQEFNRRIENTWNFYQELKRVAEESE